VLFRGGERKATTRGGPTIHYLHVSYKLINDTATLLTLSKERGRRPHASTR
jgi:hypothetical protein